MNLSKKIWLINGILVLIIILYLLYRIGDAIYLEYFAEISHGGVIVGEERAKAKTQGVELQTIRYSKPTKLLNTDYKLIIIDQTDYEIPRKVLEMAKSANDFRYGVTINAILFNEEKDDYKLILDKVACIKQLNAPTWKGDSLQHYILYDIAFHDTNNDGKINEKDEGVLFISELDGTDFTKIIPDSLKMISYNETEKRDRIEIACLQRPHDKDIPEEHWEQVTCYYDLSKKELIIDSKLNTLIEKARQILVK